VISHCAAVCSSAVKIPLTKILVLSFWSRPASSRRTCLMSESTSSATEGLAKLFNRGCVYYCSTLYKAVHVGGAG
jgi:hypothetical protein